MKGILIYLIRFYQKNISIETGSIPHHLGLRKKVCIFYPTCSEYSVESIKKHGAIKGTYFSIKRILKCTPWGTPRVDLVND